MRHSLNPRSILLFAAWFAAAADAATLTVGGSGCQFPNVQQALNQGGLTGENDEIRVAYNIAYTQQALTKSDPHAVSVIGGYANCNLATLPTGSTLLDGSGHNASLLTVSNGSLHLANLAIAGGAPLNGRGGGVQIRGSAQLTTFSNVRITANRAREGGGPDLRNRLIKLFDELYTTIKFQSSVEKYHAIHPQRACMVDFMDYPLNNRFWLEDEFHKVSTLPTLEGRWARLEELRAWENPGTGSFYDDIGNVAESPRVVRHPERQGDAGWYWWWDNGMSRLRLSWLVSGTPGSLEYADLDPGATYILRFCGFGELKPRADGQALTSSYYETEAPALKEFPVPAELVKDGKLSVTFDDVSRAPFIHDEKELAGDKVLAGL